MADLANLKPRLRSIEAFPVERDGQQWIALHDPSGFATAPIALSPEAFFIITHFDGDHNLGDVQLAVSVRFGQVVPTAQIAELANQLDHALLLDSDHFARVHQRQVSEFLANPVRPFRPQAWPDQQTLEQLTEKILQPTNRAAPPKNVSAIAGLVAPHVDYPRGQSCYAASYGFLARYLDGPAAPELVIVVGTNHFGQATGPVACDKDFATPFGNVAAAGDQIEMLSGFYGANLLDGQFDHMREHSVEMQVVLLARLLADRSFRILPLLVQDPSEPSAQKRLDRLVEALSGLLGRIDAPALMIASVDLSHVGPRFGDDRPIDKAWLESIAQTDQAAVGHLRDGQADTFLANLRSTGNPTRICGVGSLYVLRKVLADAVWQDLGYHQACDADSGTCVSCAAAALWR